jgi:hypothetical protein
MLIQEVKAETRVEIGLALRVSLAEDANNVAGLVDSAARRSCAAITAVARG